MRDLNQVSDSFLLQSAETSADSSFPMSRHLLGAQTPPETVMQFCYPSGSCALANLRDVKSGIVLQGEVGSDWTGYSVSSGGDINGDGRDDLLIGAPQAANNAGKTYVVFGTNQTSVGNSGAIDLTTLTDGLRGFVLQGEAADDLSGSFVSNAGDINGDGLDDVLIGAPTAANNAGKTYVILGSNQTNAWGSGILNLNNFTDGQRGFVLQGEVANDYSGSSISSAGDINGDAVTDIIIGANCVFDSILFSAAAFPFTTTGKSYVVFGSKQANAWASGIINLASLTNGTRGFVLHGEAINDRFGHSVSGEGDINQDGFADVLIGTIFASPEGRNGAGKTYVVFGSNQTNAWGSGVLNITSLMNGLRGFVLQGESANDFSGNSVSSVGDINGDGFGDILIGAPYASPNLRDGAGKSYVIFGSNSTNRWGSGIVNLTSLIDGQHGFVLQGETNTDYSGYSVSRAGDINGDGFADMLVGAYIGPLQTYYGRAYAIFGSNQISAWGAGTIDLSDLIANGQGFRLDGEANGDQAGWSVSAGDINGDGTNDVLIGAFSSVPSKTYIIWGVPSSVLQFNTNNLHLAAGETIRLNDSMLSLVSDRINTALIPLTIENVDHGSFSAVNASTIALTRFYPQNVSNGFIQFAHDGSPLAPAYRLVAASVVKWVRFYSDAQIDFLGYPPSLVNNQLFVDQGLATTLQQSDLSASDNDNSAGSLDFIISNVQHGQFNLYNTTGQLLAANISEFSQLAIFNRQVKFLHDGSSSAPSYDAAVTDSRLTTISQAAIITFNHAPVLTLNSMIIDQGKPTILRPQDISATDIETFNEDIIIEVSNITHGYFAYSSNPDYAITAFRQYPLITGSVQFTQDSSNTNASFSLRAFDGRIYSPWQLAQTQLNRRPVLQRNVSDISVTQGESFHFELGSNLFMDPDGEALNYTAQLQGGAPLPKGVEFIPPSIFQGNLPTLTSYQIEVQAKDPRGLIASTDFVLQPQAPSQGINLQTLYTSISSIGGIIVAVSGYMWWRRKLTGHRRGFELANNLRKAANLEYHDFTAFEGDIYKSKVENLAMKIDGIEKGFYKRLNPEQKKSFVVCLAEMLEQRNLLSPSGYGMGLYGWILAFSVGWSQQLNFKQFEDQLDEIAQGAITAWRTEANPTTRWPYFSPTCKDKVNAFCCARPSRAGLFAKDRMRMSRGQEVSMTEFKHPAMESSALTSADEKISIGASSLPRLYEDKNATKEELALFRQEVSTKFQQVDSHAQQMSQYMQHSLYEMGGNIKKVSDRVDHLEEGRSLLQASSSS